MIKFELTFKPETLAKMCMAGGPEATAATVEAIKKTLMEDPSLAPLRELFDISVRDTDDREERPTSTKLDISDEEIDAVDALVDYTAKSSGTLLLMSQMNGTKEFITTDEILEANGLALTCRKLTKRLKGE